MLKIKTLTSLHRVFPTSVPEYDNSSFSALKNEPFSFQVAFKFESADIKSVPLHIKIESDLNISYYYVNYVPVMHTDVPKFDNPPAPGIYPDMLIPKKLNAPIVNEGYPGADRLFEKGEEKQICALNDCWQAVWITVNERQQKATAGSHSIKIRFINNNSSEELACREVTLQIVDAALPKQKLYCTNWFHCDCLADIYRVELFSDKFFEIVKSFAASAATHGMNMILLPAFTPPLDTPIGTERKTVQLVKIVKNGRRYSFDFSLMKKYIDICRSAGIEYFEHSHLFTQWGATAAPKIVAEVNGKEKKIFGWETQADGAAYKNFLKQYIPAVLEFLKQEKLEKKTLFHISDEPTQNNSATYTRAVKAVGNLLDGYMVGDALSDYHFYENGIVKTPIAKTRDIHDFTGKCDNLWCYYTGEEVAEGLSNRLIIIAPERNRMLGVHMYLYNIKGFLHWAFNYYYDSLSHGLFDPCANPCGCGNNAGTSFLVYPGRDGKPISSMRQKTFFEGINDMRALLLLEKLTSREYCEQLIKDHFGDVTFYTKPESPEQLFNFKMAVNQAIHENL